MFKKIRISAKSIPKTITREILIRIKLFLAKKFQNRGLYMARTLIFIKAGPGYIPPVWVVEYLITKWYKIPIPDDDEIKKLVFQPFRLGVFLIEFYKSFDWSKSTFDLRINHLLTNEKPIYHQYKYSNIPKYSSKLKFELLSALRSFCWLLLDLKNGDANINKFINVKNYRNLLMPMLNLSFERYINPNRPLWWIRGDWLPNRTIGLAKVWIKYILFKQLYLEQKNIIYTFNLKELQMLKIAGINWLDRWYHWPTRRLFLLGQSTNCGFIRPKPFFSKIMNWWRLELKLELEKEKKIDNSLNKLRGFIVEQFLSWKTTYIQLGLLGHLIYSAVENNYISKPFKFFLIEKNYKKIKKNSPYSFKLLKFGKSSFQKWYRIPKFFFGTWKLFLPKHISTFEFDTINYKNINWNELESKLKIYKNNINSEEYSHVHNFYIFYKKKKLEYFKNKKIKKKSLKKRNLFHVIKNNSYIPENLNLLKLGRWFARKFTSLEKFSKLDIRFFTCKKIPLNNFYYKTTESFIYFPLFLRRFFDLINWITFTKKEFEQICLLPYLILVLSVLENKQYLTFIDLDLTTKTKTSFIELRTLSSLEKIRSQIHKFLKTYPGISNQLYWKGFGFFDILKKPILNIKDETSLNNNINILKNKILFEKKWSSIFIFSFYSYFNNNTFLKYNNNILKKLYFFKIFKKNFKIKIYNVLHRILKWLHLSFKFYFIGLSSKKKFNFMYKNLILNKKLSIFEKKELIRKVLFKTKYFKKLFATTALPIKNALNFFWLKFNLIEHYQYLFGIKCVVSFLKISLYYYFVFLKKQSNTFYLNNFLLPINEYFFYSFLFSNFFIDLLFESKKYLVELKYTHV